MQDNKDAKETMGSIREAKPVKKVHGFMKEYRTFISKGNVMDLAVGVIIATAFGKITTSLVNDVFMPFLGWIIGDIDLTKLNVMLSPEVQDELGEVVKPAVTIGIGTFIGTVLDFLLIALVVFAVVRVFNRARKFAERKRLEQEAKEKAEAEAKAKAEAEAKAAELTREQALLTEIRDALNLLAQKQ